MNKEPKGSGYEVYDQEGKLCLPSTMENIEKFLVKRNPEKYEKFLKGLNKLKRLFKIVGLPNTEKRILLMKYIYYSMRLVDDVFDGDSPNQGTLTDQDKKIFVTSDKLYLEFQKEIAHLSQDLGFEGEILEGISQIIISMTFDLERVLNGGEIKKTDELEENFHKMDIEGTIGMTALIFGLDSNNAKKLLKELGEITRIGYTLEDLQSDLKSLIINIPLENMNSFGITNSDISNFTEKGIISDGLKNWIINQIEKIDTLLKIYKEKIKINDLETTFSGYFGKKTQKIYNILLKKFVLIKYEAELLKTREKILYLLST